MATTTGVSDGPAVPLVIHERPYPRHTHAIRVVDPHTLLPSIHADLPPKLDVSIGSYEAKTEFSAVIFFFFLRLFFTHSRALSALSRRT
jgi:hypothetical protein